MGLNRNVPLSTALRYKGQGPYLTFILHRMGGAGMAIFVTIHVLATFVEKQGWAIGDFINDIYMSPPFQIFILFCVLFHVINGMRISILDLFFQLYRLFNGIFVVFVHSPGKVGFCVPGSAGVNLEL